MSYTLAPTTDLTIVALPTAFSPAPTMALTLHLTMAPSTLGSYSGSYHGYYTDFNYGSSTNSWNIALALQGSNPTCSLATTICLTLALTFVI